MRRNMLIKCKKVAAFALSLSMVFNGNTLAGAAEVNTDSNLAASTKETTEAGEWNNEILETTEDVEEITENVEETTENPEETAKDVEENIEDMPETYEDETEELSAYNGTPSKIIGLEGEIKYDKDGTYGMPLGQGRYIPFNFVDNTERVCKPGNWVAQTKDEVTKVYRVDGKNYNYALYYPKGDYTVFSSEVLASSIPRDPVTGLYTLNGLYYSSSTALKGREVMPVGAAADRKTAEQLAGGVDTNGDGEANYFVVNGKSYHFLNRASGGYWYVHNEISFDTVRPYISWKKLTTDNIVVNGENKKLEIGYQIKINDVVESYADTLVVSDTEGAMAIHTYVGTNLDTLVGPGESEKIQVRGIYYVKNETIDAENQTTISNHAVAVGEWSEPYNFTRGELKEVPQIGGLTAVLDGTKVKLAWNPVKEAEYANLYCIDSKIPLTNITSENFEKFYSGSEEERKNLIGDIDFSENLKTKYYTDLTGDGITVFCDRKYTYHYYALKTKGIVSNEYVDNTGYSNIAAVVTTKDANIPQVEGFRSEKKSDGTYNLAWNPVDANVVIYAYEQQSLPEFFNAAKVRSLKSDNWYENLLQAKSSVKDKYGDDIKLYDKLTSGQIALINKVKGIKTEGMLGDEGININSFQLKPGVTYYFTAFTYDDINKDIERAPIFSIDGVNFTQYTDFSAPSNVVSGENYLTKPSISTKAYKNSVKLTLSGGGNPTGYEIYRKNSKNKWKKVTSITDDVYTDRDLKEKKKYSYRVRSYYYNKDNKKTIYSEYAYKTVGTSQVTNMEVNVTMKSSSQSKVTWTKVGKAEKYEIYRSNSSNVDPKVISKKYKDAGNFGKALENEKFELIKTVKKAKTTSYTDKKLKAGETYTYVVLAYYKDGKTQGYISDSDSIEFAVQVPKNVRTQNKGTSVKVTWDADKFASRFEVKYTLFDKYGKKTEQKPSVKTTKKNSYTIKGLESGGYAEIRVRAYGRNKMYSDWSQKTQPTISLAAAGSIKAKNVTEQLAGGGNNCAVNISWKQVPWAQYYKVYRSTKTAVYDKDEKKYFIPNDAQLIAKESNDNELYSDGTENKTRADEVYYEEYLGIEGSVAGTSAVDRAQLSEGVTYYYSVAAFGEKNTQIASYITTSKEGDDSRYILASGKPASVVFNKNIVITSAKNSKKGQAVIKYSKVNRAKKYIIYRAAKKNGEFKKIATSKKTSYTDKKVKKGKTYYYKVSAIGTNKEKAYMEVTSSAKKIKIKK